MIIKKLKTKRKTGKKVPIHGSPGRIVILENRIREMEKQISDMKRTIESHSKKLKIAGSIITKMKLSN